MFSYMRCSSCADFQKALGADNPFGICLATDEPMHSSQGCLNWDAKLGFDWKNVEEEGGGVVMVNNNETLVSDSTEELIRSFNVDMEESEIQDDIEWCMLSDYYD